MPANLRQTECEVLRILTEDIGEPFVLFQSLFFPVPSSPPCPKLSSYQAKNERSLLDVIGIPESTSLPEIFTISYSPLKIAASRSMADFRALTINSDLIRLARMHSECATINSDKDRQEAADNRVKAMLRDDRLKSIAPKIKAILAPLDPVSDLAGLLRAVQVLKASLPLVRMARTTLLNQIDQTYIPSIQPKLRQLLQVETKLAIRTIDCALKKLDEAECLIRPFQDQTWVKPKGLTKSLPTVTQAGISLMQLFLKECKISEVMAARCASMVLCTYVPDMNGMDTFKFGESLRVKFQKAKAISSKLASRNT